MKKRGFTLIELLAVIVVIGIIGLIAMPTILGVIETTRKGAAEASIRGYVNSIENKVAMGELENITYEDKDDYVYDEIKTTTKGEMPTGGVYALKNGIVESGVFCMNGYEVNYSDNEAQATEKCTGEEMKLPGEVKLSEEVGYYTYPETKTIEITENISGGTLSCETSDSEVATCSVEGNKLKVVAGSKEGTATITVTSEGSSKYKEATAAYVATTAKGILSVTASDYIGVYDKEEHGITVESPNAIIKYGLVEGIYDLEQNPKYSDVGEYTVYYEITRAGYKTVTGYKTITITKAIGNIELENISGTVEYDKIIEEEITKNESEGEIKVVVANEDIVEATILDNKLVIEGKQTGKTTITLTSEETKNYNSASVEYTIEVTKAANKIELSSNSGQYTYPIGGEFEVISNPSGGVLSCESSDKKVADCEMLGTTVKVILGTEKGTATITVKSAETTNYKAGSASYVVITEEGLLSVTANDYVGIYDGKNHGITVELDGATIKYGTVDGIYDLEINPTYTDVGEYIVYYQVEKVGYKTVTGSKKVTITKAEGSVTAPEAKMLTYTGEVQELVKAGSTTTGTLEYKLGNTGIYSTEIPTALSAGEYEVYYRVIGDKNHKDVEERKITATISKATLNYTSGGYTGIYDGEVHGIIVESLNATIKYGTASGTYDLNASPTYSDVGEYTVYYEITREGYNTVTGSEKVVITQAENKIELSSTVGNYTYPNGGEFEITSNPSGGVLTCTSDKPEIAECSISGTTVTVTIKTTTGTATLTIKSAETKNYKAGQTAYVATTEKGLLSVSASDVNVVYDGQPHGIIVESPNATIKYGETEGTYDLDVSPTLTNVGTKTVYYEVSKSGYNTVTGSKIITITKAEGSVTAPTAKTLTYTGSAQNLVNEGSSNTGTIQYKVNDGSYSTIIPTGTNAGTYTVYYKVVGDNNHKDVVEKTITVTIDKATPTVTAPTAKTLTYTGSEQSLVDAGSTTGGTLHYKVGSLGTYGTGIPKAKTPGTWIVYYKVVGNNNYKDVAEKSVTTIINKATNNLTLSSQTGQYTYPDGGTFEVSTNTSGGTLSCKSSNEAVATCSISGTTVTVTPGTTEGSATLTITSAETDYYKSATASHVATTGKGLLSVSASDYTGIYDGEPHGITVTCSGATIKYGESEGTYDLDTSPTLTNAGTKTVYYQVTKAGYNTVTGSKKITITKAENPITVTASQSWKPTFSTSTQTKSVTAATNNQGTVSYKIQSQKTSEGTDVTYFTISGRTVTAAASTPAGTYTVVVRATAAGNENYNSGYKDITLTVTIGKAENVMTLSANSATYTYPNGGTFTVTSNPSGGSLSCESNKPEIVECSIANNEVTVTLKAEGTANITITSAETENYKSGTAVFVATTEKGLLSVSASDYSGIYDGEPHGITVLASGATIKYGETEGTYNLDTSPTITNVGTKTVYYEVSKAGYNTVTGSKTITITQANNPITVTASQSWSPTFKTSSQTNSITGATNNQGTVSYAINSQKDSGGTAVTYFTISGTTVTAAASTPAGTYTVVVRATAAGNTNYKSGYKDITLTVTVAKATPTVTAPTGKTLTYTGSAQSLVSAGSTTGGTLQYKVGSDGTYSTTVPKATNPGTYTIYYKVVEDNNYNAVAEKSVTTTINKAANTLTLSASTATYTYPTAGTFTVSTNTSGGTLSCKSSNEAVATCSISGTTVTVTPGTTKGNATITITSAETTYYKSATASHVATTEEGLLSVSASDVSVVYDGNAHGITVTCSGATIKYGESEGTYDLDASPTLTNVGTKTVYYQVTKAGYKTVTGSKTITITKATNPIKVTASQSWKPTFSTSTQTKTVTAATNNQGTVSYKIQSQKTSEGTTVTYFTISGRKVTAAASTPVGTYKVVVRATAAGNDNYKSGYKDITLTVTIGKAENVMTLSANTATYTYPDSGTFTVTSNPSGGALSCESSDTAVATCSISGTTVTVAPGTTKGSATITITSAETENYNAGQIAHAATTEEGLLSVSASNYSGTYDGSAHGITVTCSGATIKYGEASGTYNLTSSPTLTNVGTKTVYYQVTKAGYTTVTGSKTITISQANNPIAVTASQSWSPTFKTSSQTKALTAATNNQGTVSYEINSQKNSGGTAVTYFTISGTTVTAAASTPAGTYTVVVRATAAGNTNYKSGYKDITLTTTVAKATPTVTAPVGKTLTYTGSAQSLVSAGSTTGGTLQYKLGSDGTYGTSVPKATNPGTYTIYYKVVGDNNYNAVAEKSVTTTINKATNTLTLSANTGTYTYPTKGTFTVSKNTSGGTLSCKSSNTAVATCSISGTTVTVTPGTTSGDATITITSAETTNYKSATASHVATTALGTLSVTANNYSGAYDGNAHGITVTCSGATIKYGEASGTYNLTSSPTITNVGTKTVYYQVSKAGYKTVTGSKTITITKATNPITVTASQSWSPTFSTSSQTKAITAATNNQGTVSYAINSQKNSGGTAVTYFTISETTVKAAASTPAGTYTVVVRATAAGTDNYSSGYKDITLTVTVAKATNPIAVTASQTWSTSFKTSAQTKTLTAATGGQGTVSYTINSQKNSGGTAVTYFSISGTTVTAKASTPVGTYTVVVRATAAGTDNYNSGNKDITLAVTISKAANTLKLSSNANTYTYPTAGTFTVSTNTSGGTLSCSSSNTAVATCSISGTTVTVTPGTTTGEATLTITSAATTNYNSATVSHVATTQKGTLSVTANGFTGEYDGNAHGITVTSTTSGVTIKYGTTSGTYNLTSTPVYTSVGTYTVYYQVSKAGYTTVTGSKTVTIKDTSTPPAPTISAWKSSAGTSIASGAWSNEWISFSLSGSSAPSGISYYQYCIDTANTCTPSTKYTGNFHVESSSYIRYRAVSESGMNGTVASYQALIDGTIPTVSYNVAGGTYYGSKTVTVTGSDTNFNYMHVHVYKDGAMVDAKSVTSRTSNTYSVALDSIGTWTIYTQVFDKAGNKHNKSPDNGGGWYYQNYTISSNQWSYNYTGGGQSFTAPSSGTYKLEVWGAQGGNASQGGIGGYGGYASGNVSLTAGNTIYVYVGGQGGSLNHGGHGGAGYNGGGTGSNYSGGGGGATHIGTRNGTLRDYGNTTGLYIVAGGGGGGYNTSYNGGSGGGSSGTSGLAATDATMYNRGGTQSGSGGGHVYDSSGINFAFLTYSGFGYGMSSSTGTSYYVHSCGGGGGGLYGGGTSFYAGGAGGSGYIGGVSSGSWSNGARSGHGYAKITFVG